eukprot:TRINITY_DN27087_c0_g1_i1.p1 TRINITY_DN27087_c0_g1~~TRINITY_DN27087_c0_g1_i1.p1  ORF type:complete len:374 (+),score=118.14 TRINITY_DN27087_c0_g1_i1:89-1123(+)
MVVALNIFHTPERDATRIVSEPPSNVLIGGGLAVAYSLLLLPLDTVRARQQAALRPGFAQQHSALGVLRHTLRREGARGLFRGWQAVLALAAVHRTAVMAAYEKARMLRAYSRTSAVGTYNQSWRRKDFNRDCVQYWYTTVEAGVMTAVATSPVEAVYDNLRTQLQVEEMQQGRPPCRTLRGVANWLLEAGSANVGGPFAGSLFRGCWQITIRNAFGYGLGFSAYEKILYDRTSMGQPVPDGTTLMLAGLAFGALKELAFYPFFTVQIYHQSECLPWHAMTMGRMTALYTMSHIVERHGWAGLYAGVWLHALRTAIIWGTSFPAFDILRQGLTGTSYASRGAFL